MSTFTHLYRILIILHTILVDLKRFVHSEVVDTEFHINSFICESLKSIHSSVCLNTLINVVFRFRSGAKKSYSLDPGDVSNSEDEYSEEEKRLLEKVRKKRTVDNYDSEDEVYGLQDEGDEEEEEEDEGDDDSMKSDIEGLEEDDDLPDERAWGKKKRAFYSTDYVDQDYGSTNQQDIEAAELEEQEARNIQKRLAEQLDEADFGLDLIGAEKEESKDVDDGQQLVKTDLSKLSKRQKQALMLKESPEFSGLVTDLKGEIENESIFDVLHNEILFQSVSKKPKKSSNHF